jgi:hydroxyacylglutathione hydrolase
VRHGKQREAKRGPGEDGAALVIGWREWVGLPDLGIAAVRAKTDTGAKTSALHAERIVVVAPADGPRRVSFVICLDDEVEILAEAELVDERVVRSSTGEEQLRPIIRTDIAIGDRRWPIEISLTSRDLMGYRMLLGREGMAGLLVDPSSSFLANEAPERPLSNQARGSAMSIDFEAVPLLKDNYAYFLIERETKRAVVVDPSEGPPVLERARAMGLTLTGIWATHHHLDHVGGVDAIVKELGPLEVVGSHHDQKEQRIPHQTRALGEGESLSFGGETFRVLDIPGHTLGAIAFVGAGLALTGDTLFCAGCGRVFEGTMPMMRASLEKLSQLPDETRVLCGHEYTVANLAFAHHVEPKNEDVGKRLAHAKALRARHEPTIGGTIAEERATNPFFRWASPDVRAFAATKGPAGTDDEVFARLREAKNSF